MAARPMEDLQFAKIVTCIVETAETVAVGYAVKDGNADGECLKCGVGEKGFGVVVAIGGNKAVTAGAAGDRVSVALLAGACVIPVLVGTGGATRGAYLQSVADGLTDVTATAVAATPVYTAVHGIAMQTGVAGDLIGMMPAPGLQLEE